jgi:hypothetical protein
VRPQLGDNADMATTLTDVASLLAAAPLYLDPQHVDVRQPRNLPYEARLEWELLTSQASDSSTMHTSMDSAASDATPPEPRTYVFSGLLPAGATSSSGRGASGLSVLSSVTANTAVHGGGSGAGRAAAGKALEPHSVHAGWLRGPWAAGDASRGVAQAAAQSPRTAAPGMGLTAGGIASSNATAAAAPAAERLEGADADGRGLPAGMGAVRCVGSGVLRVGVLR